MEAMNEKKITLEEVNEKLDWLIENYKEPKEVFNFEEAMEYLRVKPTFFRNEIKEGRVRYKLKGRDYLFKKIWLDDWMER